MADVPKPFRPHDHSACREEALSAARAICARRGAKLTPIRAKTLALLWDSHQPVGAYDLLKGLKQAGFGSQPPVVYRALDFLIAQGLAHKLEQGNLYIGCAHPGDSHQAHFMLCAQCGRALEFEDSALDKALRAATARCGFEMHGATLQISGACAPCAEAEHDPAD